MGTRASPSNGTITGPSDLNNHPHRRRKTKRDPEARQKVSEKNCDDHHDPPRPSRRQMWYNPSMSNPHKIRVYSLVPFDRSAKIRWLLTELGVPFEERKLNRDAKEHETPEYLKLNPLGRVPAIEIDDLVLFESGAICTHLSDLYSDRGIIPKSGTPDRGRYEQWMHFAHNFLDTMQAKIMIIEDIPAGEYQKTKEAGVQSDLEDACVALERVLAKDSFVVADRFSAADICLGYHLYFLRMWPELDQVIAKHPKVVAYVDRLKKMPSAVKADVFSFPQ